MASTAFANDFVAVGRVRRTFFVNIKEKVNLFHKKRLSRQAGTHSSQPGNEAGPSGSRYNRSQRFEI